MSSILLPDRHTELPRFGIIALIGAGGKTSLLFWLSAYFKAQGLSVLCTTTTAMYRPNTSQYDHLVIESNSKHCLNLLGKTPKTGITYCAATFHEATGKVSGLSLDTLCNIHAMQHFDVILVEADGAHGLPIKAPAANEPCIPDTASVVIAIIGVEALFRPAEPNQIHRWASFSALTQCKASDVIDTSIILTLISEPQGLFKCAPHQAHRVMVFNKLDLLHAMTPVKTLAQKLLILPLCHSVWLTSTYTPTLNHYYF